MNDIVIGFIRTGVPYVVGALVAWLTVKGITIDATAVTGFTAFLTAMFSGLYYLVVRVLESRNAAFGKLLGIAKQPTYKGVK